MEIKKEVTLKSKALKRLEEYKEKMKNCKRIVKLKEKIINELSEQNAALDITETKTKRNYNFIKRTILKRKQDDMGNRITQCIEKAEAERKEAEEERILQIEVKKIKNKQAKIDEIRLERKRVTEEKIKRLQAELQKSEDKDIMEKARLEKEARLLHRRSKKRSINPNMEHNVGNVGRKRSRSNSPPVLMGANLNTPKTMERNAKEQTMSLNDARCQHCSGIMREDPAGSYQCDCCSYRRDRMD